MLRRTQSAVVVADPAIHSLGGHHFVAMERLCLELDRLAVSFTCLGSASVDEQVREKLPVRPCFSETIYGRTDWTMDEFHRRAESMAGELTRSIRWQRPKLVVLPTCDQVVAYALALAIERSWIPWRPKVLLWLLFPPELACVKEEYVMAFNALRAAVGGDRNIYACCETEGMSRACSIVTGLPMDLRPGPNAVAKVSAYRPARDRGPIVACVGHAHSGKGYQLLPDAIASILHQHPRLSFTVQGAINYRDRDVDVMPFNRLSTLGSRVKVTTNPVTTLEYMAFLNAADLVLLPYDPVMYRIRGSGVFNEATSLGKPTVVTAGCGFAESAFVERRAVAIESLECNGLVKAIQQAADHYEELAERAAAYANTMQANPLGRLLETLLVSGNSGLPTSSAVAAK